MLTLEEQKEVERAVGFLVDCVRKECRNSKPVILHSLRVGVKLFELGESKEVVVAGVLHDLVEDTGCQIDEIEEKFGLKVARLVLALTQEDIKDYKERWQVLFAKINKAGREARIIKLVDALDNLNYVPLIKDKQLLEAVLWKHGLVVKELESEFGDLEIFLEYKRKYKKIICDTK